jgi:hypothetical protein
MLVIPCRGPHLARPALVYEQADASFADALAALRRETWSAILCDPARDLDSPQIATTLFSVLASAA